MFDGHVIWADTRLKDMVGDDENFIVEILELFLSTVRADMAALELAVRSSQVDEVIRLTHTLKGASGNVGADAMMEMANRVEIAVKNEDASRGVQKAAVCLGIFLGERRIRGIYSLKSRDLLALF